MGTRVQRYKGTGVQGYNAIEAIKAIDALEGHKGAEALRH